MKIRASNIFVGENLNYIQIGQAYVEFEIKVRKTDNTKFVIFNDVHTNETIRLVKMLLLVQFKMLEIQHDLGPK